MMVGHQSRVISFYPIRAPLRGILCNQARVAEWWTQRASAVVRRCRFESGRGPCP
jgi:hypothetical protein